MGGGGRRCRGPGGTGGYTRQVGWMHDGQHMQSGPSLVPEWAHTEHREIAIDARCCAGERGAGAEGYLVALTAEDIDGRHSYVGGGVYPVRCSGTARGGGGGRGKKKRAATANEHRMLWMLCGWRKGNQQSQQIPQPPACLQTQRASGWAHHPGLWAARPSRARRPACAEASRQAIGARKIIEGGGRFTFVGRWLDPQPRCGGGGVGRG